MPTVSAERFVFDSTLQPKRVAKALQRKLVQYKLSHCQDVMARLYGYPGWYELDQACQPGAQVSRFDEELTRQERQLRWQQHHRVMRQAFGLVPEPGTALQAAQGLDAMGRFERRRHAMADAYSQELSAALLRELRPTSSVRPRVLPLTPLSDAPIDRMDRLGEGLFRWLRLTLPRFPEAAESVLRMSPAPGSLVDLVRFMANWSELTHHHDSAIEPAVQAYGVFACARQMALVTYLEKGIELPTDEAFALEMHTLIARFLRAQLREDYLALWERQPNALEDLAQAGAAAVFELL